MDRRLTPATPRIALASLRNIPGAPQAPRYTEGQPARIRLGLADLLAAPDGARERQLLHGAAVTVIDYWQGHAFVQAAQDGYCGWLDPAALGPAQTASHRVIAPASHLYRGPGLKTPDIFALSFGAQICLDAEDDSPASSRFARTAEGDFLPRAHIAPLGQPLPAHLPDPAAVAEIFLGTPYLWGGNSRAGIDCSGLVQAALLAFGLDCPGDSDLQRAALGRALSPDQAYRRGDLFFWKGHVAMAVDGEKLIHANGFHAAVTYEGIAAACARITAQGEGPLLEVRRL